MIETPQTPAAADGVSTLARVITGDCRVLENLSEPQLRALLDTAGVHGVSTLLHRALSETSAWQTLPDSIRDRLHQTLLEQTALHANRARAFMDVSRIWAARDIPFLLFKGTALAYCLYPEPGLRPRADTDVLFPDRAAAERAWQVLRAQGYRRRNTLQGRYVGLQFSCEKPLVAGVWSNIDCHIRVNDYLIYATAFTFDELQRTAVIVDRLGAAVRAPGTLHALMLACMHRVASLPHPEETDRLVWLYDVFLLTQGMQLHDWQQLAEGCARRKLCGTVLMTLDAAAAYFPVNMPPVVRDQLGSGAATEPFRPSPDHRRWHFYLASFRSLHGWRNRARMLREHLLPEPDYLMKKYRARHRGWLPVLYLRRIFAGLHRYFRA